MQLLGGVCVVVYFDHHWLAFFEAQQRAWKLTVIGDRRDDPFRCDFDRTRFDVQGIVRRAALGL